jgi:hypothetical protein
LRQKEQAVDIDNGWRSSTYCDDKQYACVQVRTTPAGAGVRDSTDPAGPTLEFGAASWTSFVEAVKDGLGTAGV